jgi:hypothetical protein
VTSRPPCCWRVDFDKNHYPNELRSIHISLIFEVFIYGANLQNYKSHHTQVLCPHAAPMPVPETRVPMMNRNMMKSQDCSAFMNMTDGILK